MDGWQISKIATEAGPCEAWTVLGRACEPFIWESMDGYGACVAKATGSRPRRSSRQTYRWREHLILR